ncbi:hypothetical protein MIND_00487300 [Mycena indigotica]|uniref:Uncharacterized protein n=1 Tax=Mycena indigotica TaxID=2126181 RepID=A0A8H6SXI5_9AGAR|nr:uncharacterized protein MIND_00487300 [Mycena indigotica]KAF7306945.1 hypothetical protein MIND_00487300 [Mycena indigotica]
MVVLADWRNSSGIVSITLYHPADMSNTSPPTNRSPTKRHMHNYSLPSPSALCTIPRPPARCQSSSTLTDFRQAVYMPEAKKTVNQQGSLVATSAPPPSPAKLRTTASDPSLLDRIGYNDKSPTSRYSGSNVYVARHGRSFSSSANLVLAPSKSISLSRIPSKKSTSKRLSELPITALPIPLPTPPEEGPEVVWNIDPFASTPRVIESLPRSQWSPLSSISSLEDYPPPKKLKGFLGLRSNHKSQPIKHTNTQRGEGLVMMGSNDFLPTEDISSTRSSSEWLLSSRTPVPNISSNSKDVTVTRRVDAHAQDVGNALIETKSTPISVGVSTTARRTVDGSVADGELSIRQYHAPPTPPLLSTRTGPPPQASSRVVHSSFQTKPPSDHLAFASIPFNKKSPLVSSPRMANTSGLPPPLLPPRSTRRPPPVKISTWVPERTETTPDDLNLILDNLSMMSPIISPLPTPPYTPSSFGTSSEKSTIHSRSLSTASSLLISPMPTPPSLSPSSSTPPFTPALDILVLDSKIEHVMESHYVKASSETLTSEAHSPSHSKDRNSLYQAEFAWQEEPRSPPSRLSFHAGDGVANDTEDEDEEVKSIYSIYSHFSSTYSFRSRTPSARRKRAPPVRRNNSKLERHSMATSVVSVYSQASYAPEDRTELPPVPVVPLVLKVDKAPSEEVAPNGTSFPRAKTSMLYTDDWRALLAARKLGRKPSNISNNTSNMSMVDVVLPITSPTPHIDKVPSSALAPNRRQRSITAHSDPPTETPSVAVSKHGKGLGGMLSRVSGLKQRLSSLTLYRAPSISALSSSGHPYSSSCLNIDTADPNVISITRNSFLLPGRP